MEENSWLNPAEAAELVGYSKRHIQNWISKGKIPSIKKDGASYIDRQDLLKVFPPKGQQIGKRRGRRPKIITVNQSKDIDLINNNVIEKEIKNLNDQIEILSKERDWLRSIIEKLLDSRNNTQESVIL